MVKESIPKSFVHLRVHSSYSLLEGAIRPEVIGSLCAKAKMPAVAITDTGNMFGALELSEQLVKSGVQPIIGCELNLIDQFNVSDDSRSDIFFPIVLLAQNEIGYSNLMKITTKNYLDCDQKDPHITCDQLKDYSEGLIAICGGSNGILGGYILRNKKELAVKMASWFLTYFEDRFYIEIQRHGGTTKIRTETQEITEPVLIDIAYKHDIPLVATNNVHFPTKELYQAHDALLCIAKNSYIDQQSARYQLTEEHYFKSSKEMFELFQDLPEAIKNTKEIAIRCRVKAEKRKPILPKFAINEVQELRDQAALGLDARLEKFSHVYSTDRYKERLDYELEVIEKMGFPGYFLIVADFIKWAKAAGIPVGPGRGSGAGSLVAYALTITDLDPLRYGLLFERFLNPDRVSMPDFDIDFCQDRREEVISYVQEKYGKDRVAQIITFGALLSKAAIRDVGRVLQMPYSHVDRISKMIPVEANKPVSIAKALKDEPRLQEEQKSSEVVERMLDYSQKLEGLLRNASTHAAGIVIGDRPLDELVPLYKDPRSSMPATQFSMKWVEESGLVKFDFLGLKTLTVIQNSIDLICLADRVIEINNIPLDDEKTFNLYSSAQTLAVFQVESPGMRSALTQLKPTCLEDIIALVALYRPGPMENIPRFCRVKNEQQERELIHPLIDDILDETQGIIVYQEQVMEIARKMAGYTLGGADLLRRAMGKKIKAAMDAESPKFIAGALENGVSKALANRVWLLLEKFANYGFNKSHAAAYGLLSYQTCWLKANHPVEFMAAVMNADIHLTEKLSAYVQEISNLNIQLERPCINSSKALFSVSDGKILYALGAVRNVGSDAMNLVVSERNLGGPFLSLFDFAKRIDLRRIGKRALEMLTNSGTFDSLNNNRAAVFKSIDMLADFSSTGKKEEAIGQDSLFGDSLDALSMPELAVVEDWENTIKLKNEYNSIGFYLSGHPLDDYMDLFRRGNILSFKEVMDRVHSGPLRVQIAGSILGRQERKSSRGNKFAFLQLSDPSGMYEITVFSDTLEKYRDLLEIGNAIVFNCEASLEEDQLKLLMKEGKFVETAIEQVEDQGVRIYLKNEHAVSAVKDHLDTMIEQDIRKASIRIVVLGSGFDVELTLPNKYKVNQDIVNAINHIPGIAQVERFEESNYAHSE